MDNKKQFPILDFGTLRYIKCLNTKQQLFDLDAFKAWQFIRKSVPFLMLLILKITLYFFPHNIEGSGKALVVELLMMSVIAVFLYIFLCIVAVIIYKFQKNHHR